MTELKGMALGQRLKFLLKDTAIYGIGGALNKALALITFPLLARHFSVTDFGLIDLLNTSLVLAVTLLVFGQDSAVARFFYEDTDTEYRRQVASQSLAFQIIVLACTLPLLWISASSIASILAPGSKGEELVKLMILQAPFFLFINFSQGILKWTFKRSRFLFISLGSTAVTLIGLIVSISFFETSVVEVFVVYLVTRALFGLIGLWFVRQWLTPPSDWMRLREFLPFAIPFGVICALNAVMPMLERVLTASLVGAHELGLFAAGAKVAMLLGLLITAFEIAWGPFSLSIYRETNASATYRLILKAVTVLMFCGVLMLTATADIIVVALGSAKYEGAGTVVFALSMGLATQAIGSITAVGIVFSKKSHLSLYGYIAMLTVAAMTIPPLATAFGIVGVAFGSMAAMLIKTIVGAMLAQRVHPISWGYSGPAAIGVATLAIGLFHQATYGRFVFSNVNLVPVVGLAAIFALTWRFLFDTAGRARIKGFVRAKLRY